jgi:Spy/CpxP family protein refolding chaperone
MKRILTGALAFMLFAGATQAQTKQDTSIHHHRDGHEMAMKQLNLTPDQQARLKSIHEDERKEMQTLKSNTSLTADQLKEQRKELHKKYHDQMQSVLTPAQKDQLKKLQSQRKEKGAKKGQWGKDRKDFARKGAGLENQLNLTPEQKDQLAKMRADVKSQIESIRNDQSLTQDQKKEKIHSIMKDQQEKFKSVLTQEQIEKLQSLRKEREAKNTK